MTLLGELRDIHRLRGRLGDADQTSTVTVLTHRIGAGGKLFSGERFYPGDRVPDDIDPVVLQKLRNITWAQDVPATRWSPPSDDVVASRAARLDDVAERQCGAEEHERALMEGRQPDPVWRAEQAIKEAGRDARDAERELRTAVVERNQLLADRD